MWIVFVLETLSIHLDGKEVVAKRGTVGVPAEPEFGIATPEGEKPDTGQYRLTDLGLSDDDKKVIAVPIERTSTPVRPHEALEYWMVENPEAPDQLILINPLGKQEKQTVTPRDLVDADGKTMDPISYFSGLFRQDGNRWVCIDS